MMVALQVALEVFSAHGYDTWITSANDGVHKGKPVGSDPQDPHFMGKAVDFRTHHVDKVFVRAEIVDQIKTRLAPQFYCLYEDIGGANEHLHVQFQG